MTDKERVFILRQSAIDFFGGADRGQLESMRDVLNGMSGVASAEVSLDAGEAKLAFDPQLVSREALLSAIEDAGFDAE